MIKFDGSGSSSGGLNKPKKRRKKVQRPKRKTLDYAKLIGGLSRLKPRHVNFAVLIPVLCLAIFGLMMVYSASSYNAQIYFGNRYHFLTRQAIGLILGLIVMAVAYRVDYGALRKYHWWIAGFGIFMLLLVFVPGIGVSRLGAQRWIGVGGFTMQPSEVAKFCFVIFAAAVLFIVAVCLVTSLVTYRAVTRLSIVERLREME